MTTTRLCVCSVIAALTLGLTGPASAQSHYEVLGDVTVFNVMDYGALPDDSITDETAVQEAVNNAIDYASAHPTSDGVRRPVVFFPKGTYDFAGQVTIDAVYGIDVRGSGHFPYGDPLAHQGTEARIRRATMAPIFYVSGCLTVEFEHLTFSGEGSTEPRPLVEVNTEPGLGSTQIVFRNVTFANSALGVGSTDTNNNDTFLFDYVNFAGVGTCFRPLSNQSVSHVFTHVQALDCGTVFDLSKGGNVSVTMADILGSTGNDDYVIKMGLAAADGGGPNGGVSRFANVKVDTPSCSFKLLKISNEQKVEFDALHVNPPIGGCEGGEGWMCLVENGSVSFNACQFGRWSVVLCQEGPWPSADVRRNIRFRDCHFTETDDQLVGTPPYNPRTLGIVSLSMSDTTTNFAFDKCEGSRPSVYDVFLPLLDAKYPTSGSVPRW